MKFFYLFAFFLSFEAVHASVLKIDKDKCVVKFQAQGRPSALVIEGDGGKCEGEVNLSAAQTVARVVKLDLRDFTTGMALRDRHMHEKYLETKKEQYQNTSIEFMDTKSMQEDLSKGSFKGAVPAKLVLHGVTKDVQVEFDLTKTENKITGHFKFQIKVSDFEIMIPSFMEITMADVVDVSGKVEAIIN